MTMCHMWGFLGEKLSTPPKSSPPCASALTVASVCVASVVAAALALVTAAAAARLAHCAANARSSCLNSISRVAERSRSASISRLSDAFSSRNSRASASASIASAGAMRRDLSAHRWIPLDFASARCDAARASRRPRDDRALRCDRAF